MYDVDGVNDNGGQFPTLLEAEEIVPRESLELLFETESPEEQGSVKDTLELGVESEVIFWRASRLKRGPAEEKRLSP